MVIVQGAAGECVLIKLSDMNQIKFVVGLFIEFKYKYGNLVMLSMCLLPPLCVCRKGVEIAFSGRFGLSMACHVPRVRRQYKCRVAMEHCSIVGTKRSLKYLMRAHFSRGQIKCVRPFCRPFPNKSVFCGCPSTRVAGVGSFRRKVFPWEKSSRVLSTTQENLLQCPFKVAQTRKKQAITRKKFLAKLYSHLKFKINDNTSGKLQY